MAGPWRERVAYAPTIEAQAGLAWITGFPDGAPEAPSGVADAMGGAHPTVALLVALEHRRRTGHGMFLECPMIGASLNLAAEQVIEYSASGHLIGRMGNRSPSCAPQGVYLTGDIDDTGGRDRWVAISVATDDQWRALARIIGETVWAEDPTLATFAGRRAAHDGIDACIAAWCRDRSRDSVVDALSGAGVPSEPVVLAHEHDRLAPAVWRRLFEPVEHPVTGTHDFIGSPFRHANGPHRHCRGHAPLLGEHNRDVLTRLLGYPEEEIDRLEHDGVIGDLAIGGTLH